MLRVTFYGVRGGYPASGERFAAVGSHTTCFRIDAGSQLIIIDGGTGLAPLGRELMAALSPSATLELVLLLTHGHHDHLAGLPHFLPVFSRRALIHVFGPPAMGVEQALWHMFDSPWFPVRFDELASTWQLHDLAESDVLELRGGARSAAPIIHRPGSPWSPGAKSTTIEVMRSYAHPRDGVYSYRIEQGGRSVVIATDVEAFVGTDRRLAEFARGADLLVHDAQYSEEQYLGLPTQGFGHSTPQLAAELARLAGVRRLLLTHHSPEHDDETIASLVEAARNIFPNTDAAREGQVVELRPRARAKKGR